ncbi:salivary glue protein Sgs-3-like [Penaeus indicus]|uniref:salivary glue protein Sgs-3-like n=1 Tax=Penaeus indicus TaxID=29960 RepID=UPI00300C1177
MSPAPPKPLGRNAAARPPQPPPPPGPNKNNTTINSTAIDTTDTINFTNIIKRIPFITANITSTNANIPSTTAKDTTSTTINTSFTNTIKRAITNNITHNRPPPRPSRVLPVRKHLKFIITLSLTPPPGRRSQPSITTSHNPSTNPLNSQPGLQPSHDSRLRHNHTPTAYRQPMPNRYTTTQGKIGCRRSQPSITTSHNPSTNPLNSQPGLQPSHDSRLRHNHTPTAYRQPMPNRYTTTQGKIGC